MFTLPNLKHFAEGAQPSAVTLMKKRWLYKDRPERSVYFPLSVLTPGDNFAVTALQGG